MVDAGFGVYHTWMACVSACVSVREVLACSSIGAASSTIGGSTVRAEVRRPFAAFTSTPTDQPAPLFCFPDLECRLSARLRFFFLGMVLQLILSDATDLRCSKESGTLPKGH